MKSGVIAIDGPSASGKSTVARRVAASLPGFVYVDSGALYRLVTHEALERGVPAADGPALKSFLGSLPVEFAVKDGAVVYSCGGRETGAELRTQRVNENVSQYSAIPPLRERVVSWLRSLARFGSLVVEGRDIGDVVFPRAEHKFFLDASADERARRRHQEIALAGASDVSGEMVGKSLSRRDEIDSGRAVAPLRVPDGAKVINSTSMGIDAVVALVLDCVSGR